MSPTVDRIPFDDSPPAPAACARAEAVLAAGGIVVLPTETVYGLAVRADQASALARLRDLKGRPDEVTFTWHVGSRDALERFDVVSPMARRLAARYWPGPLTLVLPGRPPGLELVTREGWTGVRLPACPQTAALLERLPFPVVASSANRSGGQPLLDAASVQAAFGDALGLVLDAGPAHLGESSVVLKLGPGHFDLLRPGILDLQALRATAGLRLGFVCTGNTCRSPMAEGLARKLLADRLRVEPARLADFGFHLRSMGVLAGPGAPASRHAVQVMAAHEVDLSAHASRPALPAEIETLDRVYALTGRHLEALRMLLPPGRAEHCALLDPDGEDVPDPIGGPLEAYRATAGAILRLLEKRLPEWA